MLRTLNILRGAIYVFRKTKKTTHEKCVQRLEFAINNLKKHFLKLLQKVSNSSQTKLLKKDEADFNGKVIKAFHNNLSNVFEQPQNKKEYSKFLDMLRYLSSTLSSAAGVVSVKSLSNQQDNEQKTSTLTNFNLIDLPITHKTINQKKAIQSKRIQPINRENKSGPPPSCQDYIYNCFIDKIILDDRQLSAQMRKFETHTVKNGFRSFIIMLNDNNKSSLLLDIVRSGSLAVDNKNPDAINENIKQIISYYTDNSDKKVLSIILNTPSCLQKKEKKIISALLFPKNTIHSYKPENIPVNFCGVFFKPDVFLRFFSSTLVYVLFIINIVTYALNSWDISLQISLYFAILLINILFFDRVLHYGYFHTRRMQHHKAANTLIREFEKLIDKLIIHIQCASGQDRTGTVLLLAYIKLIKEYLKKNQYNPKVCNKVEKWLVTNLRHFQFMSTIAAPGSEGLKKASKVKYLLDNQYNDELYSSISDTNKRSKFSFN